MSLNVTPRANSKPRPRTHSGYLPSPPDLRPSPRADCDSSRDYYSDLSTEVGAAVWVYELLLESWNDVASSGGLVLIIMAQVATVSFGAELKVRRKATAGTNCC